MKRTKVAIAAAVLAAAAIALSGCSGGTSSGAGPTGGTTAKPLQVTVWSWVADLQKEADVYNKAHPTVKVTVVNAGNDSAEYEKVRNAIKAGSGVPDAFFTGAYAVPSFAAQGQVQDLDQFGAGTYKADQNPAAWSGLSFDGKLYSMPAGIGPIVMYYRTDLFKKYGIAVPTTWDQFKAAGEKLKAEAPGVSITHFPSDYNVFKGLVAQTGQQSFGSDGDDTVVVDFDAAGSQKVASYWQGMLDDKLVSTVPFLAPEWNQAMAKGKLATLIGGSWLPLVMEPNAGATAGKWAAAPLPQWTAGENKTGDAGLAGYSIPKGAKNAKAAADFVFWLTNSKEAVDMLVDLQSQTPSYLPVLQSDAYLAQKSDFFGGQEARRIYSAAAAGAVPQPNTPVQDYTDPQLAQALGKVTAGQTTAPAAVTSVQDLTVKFAKAQGYKVKQ